MTASLLVTGVASAQGVPEGFPMPPPFVLAGPLPNGNPTMPASAPTPVPFTNGPVGAGVYTGGGAPPSINANQFVAPPNTPAYPEAKLQPAQPPPSLDRLRETIDSLELQVAALRQMLTRTSARTGQPGSMAVSAFLRGRELADRRLHRAAIDAFNDAIVLDPSNDSAFLLRGEAYQQLGDFGSAEADFTESLRLQANNSRAYVSRATVRSSLGNLTLALADANEAAARDPQNVQARIVRARIYELQGNLNQAIADYSSALGLNQVSEPALLGRATAYLRSGQFALATDDCEAASRVNPAAAMAHLCMAEVHLRQNAVDQAVASLNSAMLAAQMSGQPLPVLPQLPAILAQTLAPKPVIAVAPVESAPAPAPTPALTPVVVVAAAAPAPPASVAIAPKRIEPAPAKVTPVVTKAPAMVAVAVTAPAKVAAPVAAPKMSTFEYDRQARSLTDQGKYEDAIELLTKAISQSPKYAKAYNARGFAHLMMANYSAAVADFSEAIKLKPDYANAFHNRSVALRKLRNVQAADEDEKNASRLMAVAYSLE